MRAVAFDWGGVLIENPAEDILHYCARALSVPPPAFLRAFNALEPAFQTGELSEETFFGKLCEKLGLPLPRRSLWGEALRAAYRPRPAMFELVTRLRTRGILTVLLSNTEMPALEIYHERHEGVFDAVILSCVEGVRKPGSEIYLRAASRVGVRPEEMFFVDDREENVEGARRAGLRAILHRSERETIAEVERAVTRVSPGPSPSS